MSYPCGTRRIASHAKACKQDAQRQTTRAVDIAGEPGGGGWRSTEEPRLPFRAVSDAAYEGLRPLLYLSYGSIGLCRCTKSEVAPKATDFPAGEETALDALPEFAAEIGLLFTCPAVACGALRVNLW